MAHEIEITIRLRLDDDVEVSHEAVADAAENLAYVMLTQADDGLYTLGAEDLETQDENGDAVYSEFIGSLYPPLTGDAVAVSITTA